MTFNTRIAGLMAATALTLGVGAASAAEQGPRPMFAVIPRLVPNVTTGKTTSLPATWNYTYSSKGSSYTVAFIGANPAAPATETVPVYLIPLKLVYGTTSYDATSIIPSIEASPIFTPYKFAFGGKTIGTVQYEDAFAKVNVWGIGGKSAKYHVKLGTPTVTATQTLTIPKADGALATAFGANVILANINWFDPQIQKLITSLNIPTNALPLFVTTETYLTGGAPVSKNCCIGGYHSVSAGGQPYSHFTDIAEAGAFSQDVSALSHELGEWVDDPYTNNNSPCGILEVGDPLEREANYGDYPYTVGSFTYHLQDLALLPYFGSPAATTLKNLSTLQGTKVAACANGS